MLVTGAAEADWVIHRALVTCALVCCALVASSFVLFARDQLDGASKHQQSELAAGVPATTPSGIPAVHHPGQPRRFIDGAAHALTAPFRSLIESDNQWAVRGFSTLCALLVFGVGLGYLARFSRGIS